MLSWHEVKAGVRWELLDDESAYAPPAAIVSRSKRKLASGSGYRWRCGVYSGRASTPKRGMEKAMACHLEHAIYDGEEPGLCQPYWNDKPVELNVFRQAWQQLAVAPGVSNRICIKITN